MTPSHHSRFIDHRTFSSAFALVDKQNALRQIMSRLEASFIQSLDKLKEFEVTSKLIESRISSGKESLFKNRDILSLSPDVLAKISGGTAPAIIVAIGPIVASTVVQ